MTTLIQKPTANVHLTKRKKAPSHVRISQLCHCAQCPCQGHLISCLHCCEQNPRCSQAKCTNILALTSMTPVLSFAEGLNIVSNHAIDTYNTVHTYTHTHKYSYKELGLQLFWGLGLQLENWVSSWFATSSVVKLRLPSPSHIIFKVGSWQRGTPPYQ